MIGCWILAVIGSVSSEERSKQVDGIYLLYSDSLYPCHDHQSHHSPLSILYSANPLVDLKTHISTNAIELFFVMILTTSYAYKFIFYI